MRKGITVCKAGSTKVAIAFVCRRLDTGEIAVAEYRVDTRAELYADGRAVVRVEKNGNYAEAYADEMQ